MFSETDYDKLRHLMEESPENRTLLRQLLAHHRMEISSISHEIRNPMTLVYSTLQMIETEHPEVLSFRHWTSLRNDIEYMNELLHELSSYNNGERLALARTDLREFLGSVTLSFAASLTDTDIEFTSRIEPGLPCISIDPVKLREVLLNLLRNAQDAVAPLPASVPAEGACICCPREEPPGPRRPAIALRAFREGDHISVTVTDNGSGIAPETLDTIFEPFVTYKRNGTGLGLPIARRIARAHGGSLTAASEPGVFTRFTLTLPIYEDSDQHAG